MSVLVLVVGAAWLVAFAVMGWVWPVLALGAVYVAIAAASLSAPWPVGRSLICLYVGAAAVAWLALGAQFSGVAFLLSWVWGTFAFIGLFTVPFMVETTFSKPRAA